MAVKYFTGLVGLYFAFSCTLAHAIFVDRIAAIVNKDVVLESDIRRFKRTVRLRKELDPLFGFSENLNKANPSRNQILEFLIQEKLIAQSFNVNDARVTQEIQTVMSGNQLTQDELEGFLKTQGFTYDEYFELMRVGLQKRNLLDREIRTRVNISEDDIRNYYYNQALRDSKLPLEYELQIVLVDPKNYTSKAAAQEAINTAAQAIRRGEAFEEVAQRHSDDPSAAQGGRLGFISSYQLAEPLKSTAKSLSIGKVSKILSSPSGYMVIKLLNVRSSEDKQYQEQKARIQNKLAKKEYTRQLFLWAERARNNAYVHINK